MDKSGDLVALLQVGVFGRSGSDRSGEITSDSGAGDGYNLVLDVFPVGGVLAVSVGADARWSRMNRLEYCTRGI